MPRVNQADLSLATQTTIEPVIVTVTVTETGIGTEIETEATVVDQGPLHLVTNGQALTLRLLTVTGTETVTAAPTRMTLEFRHLEIMTAIAVVTVRGVGMTGASRRLRFKKLKTQPMLIRMRWHV